MAEDLGAAVTISSNPGLGSRRAWLPSRKREHTAILGRWSRATAVAFRHCPQEGAENHGEGGFSPVVSPVGAAASKERSSLCSPPCSLPCPPLPQEAVEEVTRCVHSLRGKKDGLVPKIGRASCRERVSSPV